MLQEKPCKHPIQPMKKVKRKAFLHLVSLPSLPPPQEKAQVFKKIYRHMYKRCDFFFLLQHEEKKIDKMKANAFSHSKEICRLASGSKCDHIMKQIQNKN